MSGAQIRAVDTVVAPLSQPAEPGEVGDSFSPEAKFPGDISTTCHGDKALMSKLPAALTSTMRGVAAVPKPLVWSRIGAPSFSTGAPHGQANPVDGATTPEGWRSPRNRPAKVSHPRLEDPAAAQRQAVSWSV